MGDLPKGILVLFLLIGAVKSGFLDYWLEPSASTPAPPSRTSTPDPHWPNACKETWYRLRELGIDMNGWQCRTAEPTEPDNASQPV